MISVKCWQTRLQETLSQLSPDNSLPRIAVLGVGQELCGDDALGLVVVRHLRQELGDLGSVLLVETGPLPESFTGLLRRFKPELILVVDAARMDKPAGRIEWIEPQYAGGISFSTHSLPLSLLLGYLTSELDCQAAILGVQPEDISFGASLSAPVQGAVDELVAGLLATLATSAAALHLPG